VNVVVHTAIQAPLFAQLGAALLPVGLRSWSAVATTSTTTAATASLARLPLATSRTATATAGPWVDAHPVADVPGAWPAAVDFDDLGLLLLGELGIIGIIGTEARLQTDQTDDDEATRSLGHDLAYQRSRGVAIGENRR
jgi:hypothetical protein